MQEHEIYTETDNRPAIALPIRTHLDGKYQIGRVLGHGGFGLTYLAYHRPLAVPVAIKEYLPRDLATRLDDSLSVTPHDTNDVDTFTYGLDQFIEEARTLERFDHPSVVRVRSFFEANGTAYLVMNYYAGHTLDAVLESRGGRLDPDDALEVLGSILDGLTAVHAHGLVHRDVKPQNVYRTDDGRSVLLDFGAARQATAEHSRSLSVQLTPGYAPFEQYSSRGNQGPWTDVYGVAATLYRMVTGERPPEATARMMGEADLRSATEFGIDERMSDALDCALALQPAQRTATIDAFRASLRGTAETAEAGHEGASSPTPSSVPFRGNADDAAGAADASDRATAAPGSPPAGEGPLKEDSDEEAFGIGSGGREGVGGDGEERTLPPGMAPTGPEASDGRVGYAGFWRRAGAIVIDNLILALPILAVSVVAIIVVQPETEEAGLVMGGILQILSVLILWGYFAGLESSRHQATFGKRALGLRVTDEAGEPIGFWRATGRHFGKVVSGLPLGIGYYIAGFTQKKQALHDLMARCLVVRTDVGSDVIEWGPSSSSRRGRGLQVAGIIGVVLLVAAVGAMIVIGRQNAPPQAQDDVVTTTEDQSVVVRPIANDTDVNLGGFFREETLTLAQVGSPSYGTVEVVEGNRVRYVPSGSYWGTDAFEYVVEDAKGETARGRIEVTVNKSQGQLQAEAREQAERERDRAQRERERRAESGLNNLIQSNFSSGFIKAITEKPTSTLVSGHFTKQTSQGTHEWPIADESDARFFQVYQGQYYAEQRRDGYSTRSMISAPHRDFVARYDIRNARGDLSERSGLVFREANGRYYALGTSGNGMYALHYYNGSRWEKNAFDRTEHLYTGRATNTAEIKVAGSTLTLFANGNRVTTVPIAKRAFGERIGIFANSGALFAFDDLLIVGLQ
jgi:serine/threonine protein kinase/uncharacterized RDD family membrane protein YckC